MDIEQIITDYIARSILTTQGDMVVRGVGVPERLASVAIGQVLKSAGVGAKPAWGYAQMSNHRMATGGITRSTAGDEVVSGLGFQPSLVFFLSRDGTVSNINISVGVDAKDFRANLALIKNVTEQSNTTSSSIYIYRAAGNNITGLISVFGADGFTVTYTLTGVCVAVTSWFAIG